MESNVFLVYFCFLNILSMANNSNLKEDQILNKPPFPNKPIFLASPGYILVIMVVIMV